MWASIRRLGTHYNRIRVLSEIENHFNCAVEQHKKIISIIENKEKDQVEDVLREHIIEPINNWGKLCHTDSPYITYFDLT